MKPTLYKVCILILKMKKKRTQYNYKRKMDIKKTGNLDISNVFSILIVIT